MTSFKQFLVFGIITLSCLTLLELCFTSFIIFKSFDNLTWCDLIITGILNVFIVFFAVSSIAGAISEAKGLLLTCLIFVILELIRMGKGLYETWLDDNEKLFNKFFVTFDAGNYLFFYNLLYLIKLNYFRCFNINGVISCFLNFCFKKGQRKDNRSIINWKKYGRESNAGNDNLVLKV